MKSLFMILLLMLTVGAASAQAPTVRFFLYNSTVPSGRILQALEENCKGAILTLDQSKADYVIQVNFNTDENPNVSLALYGKDGDSLFQTETRQSKNAVKDACVFLKIAK